MMPYDTRIAYIFFRHELMTRLCKDWQGKKYSFCFLKQNQASAKNVFNFRKKTMGNVYLKSFSDGFL